MAASPVIVATGARTPLGLYSASSAAALRAGVNRLGEHAFLIDRLGNRMAAAPDARLDPSLLGPERMLALLHAALHEAAAPLQRAAQPPSSLPLYLALPEIRPGFAEQDVRMIERRLARLADLPAPLGAIEVFPHGHAGGISALEKAVAGLAAGAHEVCLVGGVDSYLHPDTMEWLDGHRQLAGEDGRSAFVPGEGGGVLLLATEQARRRLDLPAKATFAALATATETKLIKTTDVCLGEGLTLAVSAAVARLSGRIDAIICDINGERYRGEEWGFVCLRLAEHFDDPTAYRSPADSWGDMGAASIPLFAMLACEAAARGYARGPRTLLWASSEGGRRGAAVIEAQVVT